MPDIALLRPPRTQRACTTFESRHRRQLQGQVPQHTTGAPVGVLISYQRETSKHLRHKCPEAEEIHADPSLNIVIDGTLILAEESQSVSPDGREALLASTLSGG